MNYLYVKKLKYRLEICDLQEVIYISYSAYGFTHFNKRIKVKHISTQSYYNFGLIGMYGVIKKYANGKFGVLLDDIKNPLSREGLFWIRKSELEIEELKSEDKNMTGFNKVAIVNLLDDYNKKDYGFALYDSEWTLIEQGEFEVKPNSLVVVNPRGKDNRVLGIVKQIMSLEEYSKGVNAQVVATVDMSAYNARIEEENRVKEIVKKKAAIEKELEEEINKRKTVEFYEEMANKYSDNPRLAELVAELKGLGV